MGSLYIGNNIMYPVNENNGISYVINREYPPDWFNESVVLLYDVRRQNEYNSDLLKKDNPKLIDFSGNGYDMNLHNFKWDASSGINHNEGFITFNGIDNYGVLNLPNLNMNNFTFLAKREYLQEKRGALFTINAHAYFSETQAAIEYRYDLNGKKYVNVMGSTANGVNLSSDDVIYVTNRNYNGTSINCGSLTYNGSKFILGSWWESGYRANVNVYKIILFNRVLTNEEILWTRNNILK